MRMKKSYVNAQTSSFERDACTELYMCSYT
jgi:hypothetical protein